MKLAEKHLPIVLQVLAANDEFKNLRVNVYTGSGGSLIVSGNLANENELERLKQLIAKTEPPTAVVYKIVFE
jgi:hypothetical protein